MRRLFVAASALPLLAFPGLAPADTSLGLRGGTLGGGVELSYALSQRAALRVNADGYNFKQTSTHDDIDYDMKLKLQTVSLLGDWFPFANNFRISLGAMFNGNKFALKGQPSGGSYIINGVPYNAQDVGSLEAAVKFRKAAPYLGVMFQGSPRSKIDATCTATTPDCAALQRDAASEQSKLDESLHTFKYYPVISLGLAYTF